MIVAAYSFFESMAARWSWSSISTAGRDRGGPVSCASVVSRCTLRRKVARISSGVAKRTRGSSSVVATDVETDEGRRSELRDGPRPSDVGAVLMSVSRVTCGSSSERSSSAPSWGDSETGSAVCSAIGSLRAEWRAMGESMIGDGVETHGVDARLRAGRPWRESFRNPTLAEDSTTPRRSNSSLFSRSLFSTRTMLRRMDSRRSRLPFTILLCLRSWNDPRPGSEWSSSEESRKLSGSPLSPPSELPDELERGKALNEESCVVFL